MNRKEKCEEARHVAWDSSKNNDERIKKLQKITEEYPEFMTPYTDIAELYLENEKIKKAVEMYQRIIDLKDTFQIKWDNEFGKAYLYTKNYDKAIEIFAKSTVFSYDQRLFHAFSYLKNGNREKFKELFEKWVLEDLEKSFKKNYYSKHIKYLLNEEESKYIDDLWNTYHEKYSNMDWYKFYCELYKQRYSKFIISDEEIDSDDDFEIPAKLSRSRFESFMTEYLNLDKKTMFGDADDDEYERYFELQDKLFADVIVG